METNNFDFSKVPSGYPLCFHQQCPMSRQCIHFVAGQHVPPDITAGYAIYPSACLNGKCKFYRAAREARLAWGFKHVYDKLPRHLRSMARKDITGYLGSVGTYYRYQSGERKLMPHQQEAIKAYMNKLGAEGDVDYEHYELSYDFGH